MEQVGEGRVSGEEPEGEEVGPGLAGRLLGFPPNCHREAGWGSVTPCDPTFSPYGFAQSGSLK